MKTDPSSFSDTTESVAENGKIIEASPGKSALVDAIGKRGRKYLTEKEDGQYQIDVPRDDVKAVHALKDVTSKGRRLYAERSAKLVAAREPSKVRVRNRHGKVVRIHPENEDWAGRVLGAKPVPTYVTGASKLYTGKDGMLWRDVAGYWIPTGRVCLGTPLDGSDPEAKGVQRDPDGNPWVTNTLTGEWEPVYNQEGDR
jgi:hypothetical protein